MGQEQTMHVSNELTLLETNAIQMAMIQSSGMPPHEWIAHNAADFRTIVTHNPQIVSLYRQKPEDAIKSIEAQLRQGVVPQANA